MLRKKLAKNTEELRTRQSAALLFYILEESLLSCHSPVHCNCTSSNDHRLQHAVWTLLPKDRYSVGDGFIPMIDAALFDGNVIE